MQQEKIYNGLYAKHNRFVLNKKETAKELHVSTASIDRMRKNGQLKSKMINGQVFFTLGEVSRFLVEV